MREIWVNEYDPEMYPGVDIYTVDHHRTRVDAGRKAQCGRIAVVRFVEAECIPTEEVSEIERLRRELEAQIAISEDRVNQVAILGLEIERLKAQIEGLDTPE